MDDNKRRALTSALSQIEKQFGKGAVMRMGDRPSDAIDAIPTGSLALPRIVMSKAPATVGLVPVEPVPPDTVKAKRMKEPFWFIADSTSPLEALAGFSVAGV